MFLGLVSSWLRAHFRMKTDSSMVIKTGTYQAGNKSKVLFITESLCNSCRKGPLEVTGCSSPPLPNWASFKFDPASGIELFRIFSHYRLDIPRIRVATVSYFPYLIKLMVCFFPFLILQWNSTCSLCAFHLCASLRRDWLPLLRNLTLGSWR